MAGKLAGFEILLGVSGGIAAYKAAALCSRLVREGAGVTVALTEHACRFVAPLTFSALSGRKVYTDLFADREVYDTRHLSLTERADLIVVAPATANILAKLAAGIADDLLSTLLLSAASEVLAAPAMNQRMWQHPATLRNVELLRQRGIHFVGPETGALACGAEGLGRMAEPDAILDRVLAMLADKRPKAAMPQ